ncbi:MAG: peptidylprolyl isomerase [Bryobacteraceae bacterium]|nr:peptidylprolyl isomerase [Bryobacteraceae bacterium]
MPWFVNGEQVDDSAVREEAQMMRPRYLESVTDLDPVDAEMQLREWARENVIERMLLRQTALADTEPVPPNQQESELEFRIQRILERKRANIKPPAEKEVAAFYKANRESFVTPELIRAKHVVRNVDESTDSETAEAAIRQAEQELSAGAPFEEVADRFSDCPGNGGDLGWFPKGEMVDEFEKAICELPVGSTTGIFRSIFGFHIARVYGRKPAGLRPIADVRDHIVHAITEQKAQKCLEDYLDELRAKADIRQSKGAP